MKNLITGIALSTLIMMLLSGCDKSNETKSKALESRIELTAHEKQQGEEISRKMGSVDNIPRIQIDRPTGAK